MSGQTNIPALTPAPTPQTALTVAELEAKRDMWQEALDATSKGESYQIGKLQLTRASVDKCRLMVQFYESEIVKAASGRRAGARQMRFVPRDL